MREVRRGLFQRKDPAASALGPAAALADGLPGWSARVVDFKPQYSLIELLEFSDKAFVDSAYRAILRRVPDESGMQTCLNQLRSGRASKVEVLGHLRWSPEGLANGVHVDGLLIPYTVAKWRHRRIIGPLIGWAHSLFRLGSMQRRIDTVDATHSRSNEELGEIVNAVTAQLNARVAFLENALDQDVRSRERAQAFERSLDPLYVAFEESFRGSLELIRARAEPYLEIIAGDRPDARKAPVLDLGCGRGDWLELLKEHGFDAIGIDSNSAFLNVCRQRGLKVMEGDVLELIRRLPDASISAVTGMHIAEHLPFTVLIELLDECLRVLVPGGVLALETPNPENLQVAALYFYNDPTHRNPLPPQTLSWLVEARGFSEVEIKRWTIARDLPAPAPLPADVPGADSINMLIEQQRAAPDYAVIGRRA